MWFVFSSIKNKSNSSMTLTWNSGPMSTSNPRSANPVAMTLAPLSWPSWPIFATSRRGFLPSCLLNAAILHIYILKKKKRREKEVRIAWTDHPVPSGYWRGEFPPVVSQGDLFLLPVLTAVGTAHHSGTGFVFAKDGLHGIRYFTYGASKRSGADKFFSTLTLIRLKHQIG